MFHRISHSVRIALTTGALAAALPAAAVQFDNDSGDNTWANVLNWDGDALPTTDLDSPGAAELFAPINITLNTAQDIRELQIGDSVLGAAGTTTLTIGTGGVLNLGESNNRIGREVNAGMYGEATGHVIVDGGTLTSQRTIRLSYDKPESADSILEVRSGTLHNMTNFIHVGRDTRAFNKAEFRVVGSDATLIRTEDMRFLQGFNGGTSMASFAIDSGGISTVLVDDQLDLLGATLDVSVIEDYDPANGDIRLFDAGRLTGDEAFTNFLQGSTVSASTANFSYEWTIDYLDFGAEDPNNVDNGVYLRNLVRTAIGGGINGDYDNGGQVEQTDLDFVLSNWGDTDVSDVTGWVNFPGGGGFDGLVDQNELDGVLLNWGSTSAPDFTGSAVPEPASLALLSLGGLLLYRRR